LGTSKTPAGPVDPKTTTVPATDPSKGPMPAVGATPTDRKGLPLAKDAKKSRDDTKKKSNP
jgi:hypothetical protein